MSVESDPPLGHKSPAVVSSEHSRPTSSISLSTNNDDVLLLTGLRRLSTGTATTTPLPESSPIDAHFGAFQNDGPFSLSNLSQPLQKPLRRTPSSSSLSRNERSSTPTLHKRLSINSLNGTSSVSSPRSPSFRRISSNQSFSPTSDIRSRAGLSAPPEEPMSPPISAATVAKSYFHKELEARHGINGAVIDSEAVVILQDSCYGHRFSRPRTSKAGLSTIVERPERIHASILGLASAYVWLGGRHAEGIAPPHPSPDFNKIPLVPFRIHKTTRRLPLNSPAIASIHGATWMDELRIMCDSAEANLALNGKELVRHPTGKSPSGTTVSDGVPRKLHEGDLYLCSGSLDALEGALGGVCEGVDAVFAENSTKRAFVCIRPPGHHCSADYPSGFCWLNNVHVGISHASTTHGLTHAAIIDFDLHHGDGSQAIAWDHNAGVLSLPKNARSKKTAIGYFSLHDINSYPCEMGDEDKVRNASLCLENAHGQSIWNVHLQPWNTEDEFWNLYKDRYSIILSKARSFLRSHTERLRGSSNLPSPKAAIFLSAGFDASEWESPEMQRHQVNVPTDFYARFTRDVVSLADEEGLGVDGRVISVLEGGYTDRALMSGVFSHLSGLTTGTEPKKPKVANGLGQEMSLRLGKLSLDNDESSGVTTAQTNSTLPYDPRWWALTKLEEIERLVDPPIPSLGCKKPRNATPPTYTSSTQSYTAKIVTSPRRSLSGSMTSNSTLLPPNSRPPSPPPPAVDWATAARELSKLLIPSDRQTRSCQPEELNAGVSRARKDRQSIITLPVDVPAPEGRMQLRDRKAKPTPKYVADDHARPVSRSSRRQTVANVASLDQDLQNIPPLPAQAATQHGPRQTRRRASIASSVNSMSSEQVPGLNVIAEMKDGPPRNQITVRKTRVPSNLPEVKSRAARKQPLGPRMPSSSAIASEPDQSPTVLLSDRAEDQAASAAQKDLKNSEVENLTSGMKKMSIKLNLPSKEEQEAREPKMKPSAKGRAKTTTMTKTRNPRAPTKITQAKPTSAAGAFKPEGMASQEAQTKVPLNPEAAELQANSSQTSPQDSVRPQALPFASDSIQINPPQNPSSIPSFFGPNMAKIPDHVTANPIPNPNPSTANPTAGSSFSSHPQGSFSMFQSSARPTTPTAPPPPPPLLQSSPTCRNHNHLPIFTSTSSLTFANVPPPPSSPPTTTQPSAAEIDHANNNMPTTYAQPPSGEKNPRAPQPDPSSPFHK